MTHPLILPMLVLMAIPLLMVFVLAFRRIRELREAGGIPALREAGGFTPSVINMSDNLKNQFEMPVIFYGLSLIYIATGYSSEYLVVAAWIYVILRYIHAIIQCTNNKIFPNRFITFGLSVLILIYMWLLALLEIIVPGIA